MRQNKYLYALVILAAFMASPAIGYPYKVNCDGISFTATSITSVFGEARKAGAQRVGPFPASVVRFHKGVDVADCGEGEFVFPIEAGTVTECLGIKNGLISLGAGIRIQGQHIFDYIHVDVVDAGICDSNGNIVNASVNPTTSIGTINSENHLHLDQLQTINGVTYDINPETNGLDFSDSDVPQFDMITVGGVTADLIPIDDDTLSPLSPSSQGETFLSPLFRGYGEPT